MGAVHHDAYKKKKNACNDKAIRKGMSSTRLFVLHAFSLLSCNTPISK